MKIFQCEGCEKVNSDISCIIIIDDGGMQENCPYMGWSDKTYPEWKQINEE